MIPPPRWRFSAAIVALLSALPSTISAQDLQEENDHRRIVQGELLATDAIAAAAGLTVALVEPFTTSDRDGRVGRGAATMLAIGLLAGPSIHWGNQHYAHGFLSAATRALLPPTTAVVGLLATCMASDTVAGCARPGAIYGAAAGVFGAALLDGFLITRLPTGAHPPPSVWYGWQTLLVDAAGLGLGIYGFARSENRGVRDGILVFPLFEWIGVWLVGTVGAPIVHFVHLEWLSGLESLALRAFGSPLLAAGGIVAYCAAVGGETGCSGIGFSWGLMGGALFVSALDATILARKKIEGDTNSYIGPGLVGDAPGMVMQMSF